MFTNEIISDCEKALLDDLIKLEQEYGFILLRLLNIAIFNSHIFQYISACYA